MGRWQKYVIPEVLRRLRTYTYRPTVRGMFYNLTTTNTIKNTQKEYKAFVDALSRARRNGSIPIDAFADSRRWIEDINDRFQTPYEFVDDMVTWLKDAKDDYFNSTPKWHGQKHYVELMIEKDALRGLFKQIVDDEDLQVRVVPNNGWSSIIYRQDNINRILKRCKSDRDKDGNIIEKDFHVLYFGDYDPSGRRMDRNIGVDLALAVKGYRGKTLERKSKQLRDSIREDDMDGEVWDWLELANELELFKRVALTRNQIEEYELGSARNPDPEVMKKLKNDPNAEAFRQENNGELFQIELDAMQKENTKNMFKQLVVDSVKDYFDQYIYEGMKNEYTPDDVENEVNKRVEFLD